MRIIALFGFLLLNCGEPPPDPGMGLELGTGFETYAPVTDGDTVSLVTGCQGSQHVWTAVRAWGIDRRGTIIDVALVRDRDEVVVSQTFRVRISLMEVPGESYYELPGLTLQVPDPSLALDEELTLRAVVTDMAGEELLSERSVRLEWDPEGGCG